MILRIDFNQYSIEYAKHKYKSRSFAGYSPEIPPLYGCQSCRLLLAFLSSFILSHVYFGWLSCCWPVAFLLCLSVIMSLNSNFYCFLLESAAALGQAIAQILASVDPGALITRWKPHHKLINLWAKASDGGRNASWHWEMRHTDEHKIVDHSRSRSARTNPHSHSWPVINSGDNNSSDNENCSC